MKEKANKFLFLLILTIIVSCNTTEQNKVSKESNILPNIILIIGDDQGYPYFGFMGADYVHTPNMDTLAASGTLFTNGYVPKNHCRPSLQSLMTGTLPIDYEQGVNQLIIDKKVPKDSIRDFKFHAMKHYRTLPKILSEHGYKSFQGGKWWEFNYQNGGFDEGMTTGWTKDDMGENDWFLKFMGGEGRKLARATIQPVYDFIDKHNQDPFFIWYAPELPHYPFDAPDKYYDIYRDKDMSESAKRYYANCTWFDDGVGELIRYMKEKDEFTNTLFIYVNDNGWEQEPHQEFRHDSLRWHNGGDKGKLSVYDQSFRTPIIFSWSDQIKNGKRIDQLIHSTDIPATILDYLDLDIPSNYHGVSYKEIINGSNLSLRDTIIGHAGQMRSEEDMMGMKIEAYWLRTKDWFFSWNLTLGSIQLFDMNIDPKNEQNLSNEYPDLVDSFKDQIRDWKEPINN